MGTTSEKLALLITADVKGAVKGFEKVGKSADRDLGRADKKLDKTAARLTKMGATALAASGVMAAALASTLGPASDLNEAINVSQLVFGDASKEMEDWASTAATSIGQSKRAALEGAAAIGGLLQNVGFLQDEVGPLSQDLVVLASDMASAFNTDPAQALEALRSGLSGQSEPLRKYNVFLSEAALKIKAVELGLGDGTRALSENEKAQARLAIITEQTALIQGDFANTSEGAANAQRVLSAQFEDTRASIGQAVLPLFEDLLGVVNGLFGSFNSLSPETKELIGKIILLSTAVLALGGGMSLAVGKAIKMRSALKDLRTNGLSKATVATGAMTLAVVAATIAWKAHNDRIAKARELAEGFADSFAAFEDPIDGVIDQIRTLGRENEQASTTFAKLGRGGIRELAVALLNGGEMTDEFRGRLEDAAGSAVEADLVMRILSAGVEDGTRIAKERVIIEGEVGDSLEGAALAADAMRESLLGAKVATQDAGRETKKMSGRLKTEAAKFDDVAEAAEAATDKLGDYFDIVQDTTRLVIDWERSIDAAVEAQEENKLATDRSTEAGVDNLEVGLDLLGVLQDVTQAKFDETGSTEEAIKAGQDFVDQLKDELVQAGFTEEAVESFIEDLNLVPGDYVATLTVEDTQAITDAEELRDLLETIDNMVVAPEIRGFIAGGGLLPGGSGLTGFAPFQATGLRTGGGFNPNDSFFVQRAKAGDDSLKQANIDVASAKSDLSDATSALATSRAEIAQAKLDITAAKEAGDKDALAAARSERDAARRDRDAAKEDIARATAAQIEAERKVIEANKEITDAKRGLAISQALAAGDTVQALKLAAAGAQANVDFLRSQGAGEAQILAAMAAAVTAASRFTNAQDDARAAASIPSLAHGAVVKARPGGTIVRVAEAGRDEVIRPLPLGERSGRGSGTVNNNYYISNPDPDAVVRAIEQAEREGRIGSLSVA